MCVTFVGPLGRALLAVVVAQFALGCGAKEDREAQAAPVATPSSKSPSSEIRGRMAAFGQAVRDLYSELDHKPQPRLDVVLKQVDAIDAIAKDLQDFGEKTGHPLMTTQIPRFRKELAYARDHIDTAQPELRFAGGIVGACAACHDLRTCPFDGYGRCIDAPIY